MKISTTYQNPVLAQFTSTGHFLGFQYAYCANNPIRLIDPDGRKIWITGDDGNNIPYDGKEITCEDNFTNKAAISMNYVASQSEEAKVLLQELIDSPYDYYVKSGEKSIFKTEGGAYSRKSGEEAIYFQGGGTIFWNSNGTDVPVAGKGGILLPNLEKNANMDLFHELAHGRDAHFGTFRADGAEWQGVSYAEWSATHTENLIRCGMKLPLRTHYKINKNGGGEGSLLKYNGRNIMNKYYEQNYECR